VAFTEGWKNMNAAVDRLLLSPATRSHERITARYRADAHRSLWVTMSPPPGAARQNFTLDLLEELSCLQRDIVEQGFTWPAAGVANPVDYVVLRSAHPQDFSLGGDLAHFRECIRAGEAQALRGYAIKCIDMIHQWSTRLNTRTTTISLVQGRALGGGFETALASDYLIAEKHSEFGFPEIVFGLFPCTGAMSLLARRIGVYAAERMMTQARIYSAEELLAMGLVDQVVDSGDGAAAAERFIAAHAKQRPARLALLRARNRMTAVNYDELRAVVDEWVEAAMNLGQDNLRVMDMLIKLQGTART
jgi:DSF synthase